MARYLPLIAFLLTTASLVVAPVKALATISDTDVRTVTALGNGVTTNYTIGFTFQDNDEVHVYRQEESATPYVQTEIIQGAGALKFQISGGDPGTTVVMGTAPSATQRLIIKRVTALVQSVDYVETDAFPAEDHEEQMDRMVQMLQETEFTANQCVALSGTSTATVPTFPEPEASKFVVYDSAGTDLTLAPSTASVSGDILKFNGTNWVVYALDTKIAAMDAAVAAHIANVSNPHAVTATQVGNTLAQWNANKINGVTVDSSAISNGRVATYDSGSGTIIWSPAPLAPNLTNSHLFVGDVSNQAVDVAVSGDVSLASTGAVTIANSAITNAKVSAAAAIAYSKLSLTNSILNSDLAQIATAKFKGRTTAGTGDVEDLTATQATALLNAMVGDSGSGGTKGLVPAPGTGDAAAGKFLKADGTWTAPAGAGTVTSVGMSVPAELSVSGSPVTGSGTLAVTWATETARTFLSGPLSGVAAAPTFKALTAPTIQKFTVTGTTTGYLFTVTAANATVGATYTNNGNTYTVLATIAAGTKLFCSQAAAPQASGTLTKASGTGDATITFSANRAIATYTTPTSPAPLYVKVRMVGGGGGGGGSGTTSGTAATAGSDSLFGSNLLSAGGGAIGARDNDGGAGGTSSLGTGPVGTALAGGSGSGSGREASSATTASPGLSGGGGGSSAFGGAGGGGSSGTTGNGQNGAANTGGGGGGAAVGATTSDHPGSGGGAGGFVDALISGAAASYPYAVGAGGTGQVAGASGSAGGNGGSGYLEVTEYYQ